MTLGTGTKECGERRDGLRGDVRWKGDFRRENRRRNCIGANLRGRISRTVDQKELWERKNND